jgi:hypothetical protein
MISNLNEVNRVLLALRQLSEDADQIPYSTLHEYLKGEVLAGRNPDFEPILDFAKHLDLISLHGRIVRLTNLGSECIDANPSDIYELQAPQCALLFRKCYLDGALRKAMKEFVKKLSPDAASGEIMWSAIDSEPLGEIEWLRDHLVQLGVLTATEHLFRVAPDYKETVSQFLDGGGDFTEQQMEISLREKRLLGSIAESFVFNFEKKRLLSLGHKLESACVQQISKLRVNAGFDVSSFDGASKGLAHNRFIEVKGSGKTTVRFVWTRNEMQKASDLGDKYWIYFVGGIERNNNLVTREPVMLQNPHAILKPNDFRVQPEGMLVEGNICGAVLSSKCKIEVL